MLLRIASDAVAVRTHSFKVRLATRGERKIIHLVVVPDAELRAASRDEFAVSTDELERRAALDFFAGLEDGEERIWNPDHMY